MKYSELTIEERVPVLMAMLQSGVASAFYTITNEQLPTDKLDEIIDGTLSFLPQYEKEWLFKYYSTERVLTRTKAYMDSLEGLVEPGLDWVHIDKHEEPMEHQNSIYLSLRNMPDTDLEAFALILMFQSILEIFVNAPKPSETCYEDSFALILQLAEGFIPDPGSRELLLSNMDDENIIRRVHLFIESFNLNNDRVLM